VNSQACGSVNISVQLPRPHNAAVRTMCAARCNGCNVLTCVNEEHWWSKHKYRQHIACARTLER